MMEPDNSNTPRGKPKVPFQDARDIDLEARGELEYWLKVLNTTKDELLAAISAVGPYAGPVATYLKRKKEGSGPNAD
jgi:Protein of unknown function (DUF3606)